MTTLGAAAEPDGTPTPTPAPPATAGRRGLHGEDPRVHDRAVLPDRAGRSPARVGARSPRPRRSSATSSARPSSSPTRRTSTATSARWPRRRRGSRSSPSAGARRAARCCWRPSRARRTSRRLDRYKEITAKLADPRKTHDAEAAALVARPSRSTGSPARSTRPRPARPRC